MALVCICQFTRSQAGETAELEGRHLIINTLAHPTLHSKGIHGKDKFWLGERRKRVRRY